MARVPLQSQIEVVDEAVAAILRTKSPAEKFADYISAKHVQKMFMLAGIRTANPNLDEEGVQREYVRRLLRGSI
jgi:hypothetical protein